MSDTVQTVSLQTDSLKKLWQLCSEDLALLARLHAYELDQQTLDLLEKSQFPYSLALSVDEGVNSEKPVQPLLKKALEEIFSKEVSLDDLAADFSAIYLNVAYQASPNESAWLDDDHLERQEPMFEVRNWYTKYKLSIENWRVRQDDNLSLQLLFLSHLLKMEKVPLADIAHFMDFHLLRWVDEFAEKIFQRAETGFYATLALLTSRYANELRDIAAEILAEPRPTKEEIKKMAQKEKVDEPAMSTDPLFYTSFEGGW